MKLLAYCIIQSLSDPLDKDQYHSSGATMKHIQTQKISFGKLKNVIPDLRKDTYSNSDLNVIDKRIQRLKYTSNVQHKLVNA